MRRFVPIAVLFFVLLGAAVFAAPMIGITWPWQTAVVKETLPHTSQEPASAGAEGQAPDPSEAATSADARSDVEAALAPPEAPSPEQSAQGPRIEFSRIAPEGASVLAGRASPNAYVTVREGDAIVGTAKADDNGEWSLVTEHKFATPEPKFAASESMEAPQLAEAVPEAQPAGRGAGETAQGAPDPKAVEGEALRQFEALVADARKEHAAPSEATAAAPSSNGGQGGDASATPTAPAAPSSSQAPASVTVSIPVPITFAFNAAELTPEGERAARLLLEYVTLKGLSSVSLTGHADERGSDSYNLDLSRERLERVAKILKDGGFRGQLDLVAKGSQEPYRGIDRSRLSGEALYQLDRRVELHFIR